MASFHIQFIIFIHISITIHVSLIDFITASNLERNQLTPITYVHNTRTIMLFLTIDQMKNNELHKINLRLKFEIKKLEK